VTRFGGVANSIQFNGESNKVRDAPDFALHLWGPVAQTTGRMSEVAHPSSAAKRSKPGLTLLAAFLGWMFDGMEMGIFPLVAGPALKEMGAATNLAGDALSNFQNHWMGIVTAAFLLGAAAGGVVFGWLGDRIGRVRALTWSILFYSGFTGLCYFAAQPEHLTALRFLASLGMGGEWSLGVALVMECWPEKRRPILAGAIGASANVGYLVIGVIAANIHITDHSWRWVMLVGAAPAALVFLIRLFVPESEKWEHSVQNIKNNTPVRDIFSPALRGRTFLAIAFASIALIVTWGIVQWIPLWAEKIVGAKDPAMKATVQMWSAGGAVIGSLIAPVLGGIFGRRITYFFMCVASIGACQWLFRGVSGFGPYFLFVTGLVGMTTAAFYGWLPLYLPELFPTRMRATGQGLAFNSGRILAAVGAWQMANLISFFGGDYAKAGSTLALTYLLGMALIWLAPETRNRPLPD
jgi:MFS transporter, SHS family, sialic acid transporter